MGILNSAFTWALNRRRKYSYCDKVLFNALSALRLVLKNLIAIHSVDICVVQNNKYSMSVNQACERSISFRCMMFGSVC